MYRVTVKGQNVFSYLRLSECGLFSPYTLLERRRYHRKGIRSKTEVLECVTRLVDGEVALSDSQVPGFKFQISD